jgi:hypothetical protein
MSHVCFLLFDVCDVCDACDACNACDAFEHLFVGHAASSVTGRDILWVIKIVLRSATQCYAVLRSATQCYVMHCSYEEAV